MSPSQEGTGVTDEELNVEGQEDARPAKVLRRTNATQKSEESKLIMSKGHNHEDVDAIMMKLNK